jgi:hypothetical protein
MLTQEKAEQLAREWIAAWNSHDIDSIMHHYSETVVFASPLIMKILNIADGTIIGKEKLRAYFITGLTRFPELNFKLYQVLAGCKSMVIHYKSVNNLVGAEMMVLDDDFKVKSCLCHYTTVEE